ncbi:hypothetical protein EJ05DRAFT_489416 [Pseudovirgaria hyperparasitica]|uniref:RING-type domain-containing protein n=1 Tax=Pseudovirgaria hyperparasitica TaxID=470096 RepID=A0A6A6VU00_9PEZI|nr:uncharacterized protein EJ05DRAFT_489416 [Pseudovirgaria hyperparasitica]KAF2754168.1 hypothetical protein EJ05DRAFT_489416 [Pseudovirgaria hyperparasitica]
MPLSTTTPFSRLLRAESNISLTTDKPSHTLKKRSPSSIRLIPHSTSPPDTAPQPPRNNPDSPTPSTPNDSPPRDQHATSAYPDPTQALAASVSVSLGMSMSMSMNKHKGKGSDTPPVQKTTTTTTTDFFALQPPDARVCGWFNFTCCQCGKETHWEAPVCSFLQCGHVKCENCRKTWHA